MREIRFRSWDDVEKKMVRVYSLAWPPSGLEVNDSNVSLPRNLMQYTGLKDKNGLEVYEGDILKTPLGVGCISWEAPMYWLQPQWTWVPYFATEKGLELNDSETQIGWSDVEIIGNIHQNPELIAR